MKITIATKDGKTVQITTETKFSGLVEFYCMLMENEQHREAATYAMQLVGTKQEH